MAQWSGLSWLRESRQWFGSSSSRLLIIEFAAYSLELAFLVGSIYWSDSDALLLLAITPPLLILTNLLLAYPLAAVPHVLQGSVEQKVALADAASPSDAPVLP